MAHSQSVLTLNFQIASRLCGELSGVASAVGGKMMHVEGVTAVGETPADFDGVSGGEEDPSLVSSKYW